MAFASKSFFVKRNCNLTYLSAGFLAVAIEDAVLQLNLLEKCNTNLRIRKTHIDKQQLLATKYNIEQTLVKDELEGIQMNDLQQDVYKLKKLDSDRNLLDNALRDTYASITVHRNFDAIFGYIDKIISRDNHRGYITDEEMKNKTLRRELHKKLRQLRNHVKLVSYETDAQIKLLKSNIEDALLNFETQRRYVECWQQSRSEQHNQVIRETEEPSMDSIEEYKYKSCNEHRVHSEVELLVNIHVAETQDKVESWMKKYDTDMEAIDLKIQIRKNEFQNALKKRNDLEDTLEEHKRQMKEWNSYKDEREKARQYVEKMTQQAIIIQAWWRGLLVRKQLGPFKVVKKRKPKQKP